MILLASLCAIASTFQANSPEPLFALATEPLTIPASEAEVEWSYLNLVEDYLRVTGQQFSYTEETKLELSRARSNFVFPLEVPAEAVQHVFECLLAKEHFTIVPDRSEHDVKIHTLLNLGLTAEFRDAVNRALPVSIEDLSDFKEQPAVLVECLVPTGKVDARMLSNAVRAMLSGASSEAIVPMADANAILVRGRGPTVIHHVQTWQRVAGLSLISEEALSPQQVSFNAPWPLPVPEKPSGPTLLDLLQAFETETGMHMTMGAEIRSQVSQIYPAAGLPPTLAPNQVQQYLERLLVLHGFFFDVIRKTKPLIMSLQSHHSRGSDRTWAPDRIDPETLADWASHPAIRIRTEFSTGKLDARVLANTFRGYITHAGEEYYLPLGDSNWLAAGGYGPMLASRRAFIEQASEFVPEVIEEEDAEDAARQPAKKSSFNPLGGR